jgi:1-acyl-sn-glycerol-3-phosphate acyltransferase
VSPEGRPGRVSVTVPVSVSVPASAAPAVAKALQARRRLADRVGGIRRSAGFPLTAPTWPSHVERPPVKPTLGADFDTEWSRRMPARVARALVVDGVLKPAVAVVASPTVSGLDRLDGFDGPLIFTSNHASHLDTPLLLTSLPDRFRHRAVVAGAADYFFDRRGKAIVSALALGAVPIDRTAVSRQSLHHLEDLLEDGWNVIIFPEGGRTADGWAQEFKAGAAYLATRAGVPVVPVHVEGSRRAWRKGGGLHRTTTHVTYGKPLRPGETLSQARALAAELERAVAVLGDEQATDWWSAQQRAAAGTTPSLRGPDAGAWRRSWTLGEGRRRESGPRWPS